MKVEIFIFFLFCVAGKISDNGIQFLLEREGFNIDNFLAHTTNEKAVWIFLKQKGFTDAGAAGLMGNLHSESKIQSIIYEDSYKSTLGLTNQEYVDKVNNGEYTNFVNDTIGFGLAQWTYPSRKQALLEMCIENIGDLDCQLRYLIYELNTDFKQILDVLKSSDDVYECTVKVMIGFEKPADQSETAKNKRNQISESYYNDFTFYGFTYELIYFGGYTINQLIEVESIEEILYIIKDLIKQRYEYLIDKHDIIYHFNQNQFDALISFVYNMGNITQLTDYGKKTIEEISSNFLNFIYDKKGNLVQERRELEKQLFDKPLNPIISRQLKINFYEPCSGSDIFSAILSENEKNSNEYANSHIQDIGIIYYDTKTGKSMKTLCQQFYIGSIDCWPYYPIQEGEYIIKLEKNGYFENGLMVSPFNLGDVMYSKKIILNEEKIEDRRVKIYNLKFQLPLYIKYSDSNYLYGNFFYYFGRISLYNKNETIKNNYPVEVELIYCYLNHSCTYENEYQINCKINNLEMNINGYGDFNGDYLLTCQGLINTNVYNFENFGGHIELKYKVGESSIQNITFGLLNPQNFVSKSPRDILEITSYTYEYIGNDIIFKFYGNSINNRNIRQIGSPYSKTDFGIFFRSAYDYIYNLCYLYNNKINNFIIECKLNSYFGGNRLIFYVEMGREFLHEENNEYDLILPFYFDVNAEINLVADNSNNCFSGINFDESSIISPDICKQYKVNLVSNICDISSDGTYCTERPKLCTEVKNGASIILCSKLECSDNSKVCIKEGDSCVETEDCTKVSFYGESYYYNCEKLKTKSLDNMCIRFGGECIEINKEIYNNRNNYHNDILDENKDNINYNDTNENGGSDLKKENGLYLHAIYLLFLIL